MILSTDYVLSYVLRDSGVLGRLTSGRIEKENDGLRVYNTFGEVNEYVSGFKLRSWRVCRAGIAIPDWSHVSPEDSERLPAK